MFHRVVGSQQAVHAPQMGGSIPMSFNDPVFANVVDSSPVNLTSGQSLSDKSMVGGNNGDQWITWNGGTSTIARCRINGREGIRIANSGTLNINSCWIEVDGLSGSGDHADGMQAYGTPPGTINISNSTFRAYRGGDGPGGEGSVGIFWADGYTGSIVCRNVLFWSGNFGAHINADTGTTILDFEDVYFVGPFGSANIDAGEFGGTISVTNWTNVREATIVDGVIVPGNSIPSP